MSDEILKALMQLFGIISNQDAGVTKREREFVNSYLHQTLNPDEVSKYLELYDEYTGFNDEDSGAADTEITKRTSVADSVMSLKICKQINETLTQKQKIVVLIRMFELVNVDKQFTEQKMAFVDTSGKIFNIAENVYRAIYDYVLAEDVSALDIPEILFIEDKVRIAKLTRKHIESKGLDGRLIFLKIESENLYFLKYDGESDIYLNGLTLHRGQINLFAYGSAIKLPQGDPIYYSDITSRYLKDVIRKGLSFIVKDLAYKFPNGNIGVTNINISEGPGQLIGFMGASGAGKTTLLNVLSGMNKPSEGEVKINGINIHTEKQKIEGVIGFVAQDDLLLERLSVYQNLYYNAKLCFKDLSSAEIKEKVEKVLKSLGLFEIKNLEVGTTLNKKISGGQRKRLNIALELIREPTVLFLDEPTSGLSSRDSENIVDLLKELALKGKLVFVVIHQPSSDIYKMFDKVFILDEGGFPVYYGNPVEAVMYFKRAANQLNSERGQCPDCGNVNPELIFNIIEAKVVNEYGTATENRKILPNQWFGIYKEKIATPAVKEVNTPPPRSLNIASKFSQLRTFITRDFLSKLNNKQYLLINLIETPILAFILAFIIRYASDPESNIYIFRENKNIPAYIFMCLIVALFVGLTVSAEEIFRDRRILKREAFLNLSWGSYLFSKLTLLFIISAIQMYLFVLIGNWILDIKGMGFSYWLVLFSVACFANVLGLNISSAFNSAVTIYILIPVLLIPQMILGGAMFKFEELNRYIGGGGKKVPVIADMMTSRWGYEALMVNQFVNNEYQKLYYDLEKKESNASFNQAYLIPELISTLNVIEFNLKTETTPFSEETQSDISLLKNEISRKMATLPHIEFRHLDKVSKQEFNPAIADSVRVYFDKLNDYFNAEFLAANNQIDLFNQKVQSTPEGRRLYDQLKDDHHNTFLAREVKNRNVEYAIIERNNELIQRLDPVYLDPKFISSPIDFRTHFYAPSKHFVGKLYDTYYFNILIIWIMSILLHIALYFKVMEKLMFYFTQKDYRKFLVWNVRGKN
ncbi:MAG: ATP-binding cassette domain-containing protein [Bacteroidetes bacterium]|nr:ATP-binding cassette domain-containing protein [Bacteroidota bacterium]